jgi:hypothetical protein
MRIDCLGWSMGRTWRGARDAISSSSARQWRHSRNPILHQLLPLLSSHHRQMPSIPNRTFANNYLSPITPKSRLTCPTLQLDPSIRMRLHQPHEIGGFAPVVSYGREIWLQREHNLWTGFPTCGDSSRLAER